MPADTGTFCTVSRTDEEISLVIPEDQIPAAIFTMQGLNSQKNAPPELIHDTVTSIQGGWRILKVMGPLDFSETGILSSILEPLRNRQISVFTVSTYNTDYILVRNYEIEKAVIGLRENNFSIDFNTPAIRCCTSCAFQREGTFRDHLKIGNTYRDLINMSNLEDEYFQIYKQSTG